ncbi:DUF2158 domain-containing protein [Verticiella sediminum]|uniref:DUF2158 domain-containing protein n=1 Tax=Verticiella sediminum TaxID=1247510 RepID=A0A556AB53_9BURK|nr:DUF2158 domain-containing protein [Verticiella sediminum]TSH90101.1 DUF2158 domain-containing protein [Verticiella sediminum]
MFSIGDVVRLRSGGFPMTIIGVRIPGDVATCRWVAPNGTMLSEDLPFAAIEEVMDAGHLDGTWELDGTHILNEAGTASVDFDGSINPLGAWADIPQLSTQARALGGAGGPMNAQAVALAARLNLLREGDGSQNLGDGSRTVNAALDDVFNVCRHGVEPVSQLSGVVDNTSQIQAAIHAANSHRSGRDIFFPSGVYGISGTVNLPIGGRRVWCSPSTRFVALADVVMFDLNPAADPYAIEATSQSYGEWYGSHFLTAAALPDESAACFRFFGVREMKFYNVRAGDGSKRSFREVFEFSGLGGHLFQNTRSILNKRTFHVPHWSDDVISGPVTTTRLTNTNVILAAGQQVAYVNGGWNRWVLDGGFVNGAAGSKVLHFTNNIDGQGLWFTSLNMEQLAENCTFIYLQDVGGPQVSSVEIEDTVFKGDPEGGGAAAVALERVHRVKISTGRMEQTRARGNWKIKADQNCRYLSWSRDQNMAGQAGCEFLFPRRYLQAGPVVERLQLTIPGWAGESRGSDSVQLSMSTLLGGDFPTEAPPVGYDLLISARDSGSSTMVNRGVEIGVASATPRQFRVRVNLTGIPDNHVVTEAFYAPADGNGDIFIQTFASGVGTLAVWVQVRGIYN